MQEVAAINIAELWTHVGVPVLGIYGTGDFVTAEDDHRRIVAIVTPIIRAPPRCTPSTAWTTILARRVLRRQRTTRGSQRDAL
jgi:hypothetical protein